MSSAMPAASAPAPGAISGTLVRNRVALLRTAVVAGSVLLLEALSRIGTIDPVSFIAPSRMAASAWEILRSGTYNTDIMLTLYAAGLAVLLAVVFGFLFGVLLFKLPRLRRVLDPLLLSYYAVPIFVLYPMLIVLFGLNRWPLVALGFLFAVVAMAVNTLNGLERVPAVLLRTARMLRMGRASEVRLITLPASLPFVFTGVKLSVVY
jgi:ABC-type nitrate/sulfonate/bicarbonate transport system permease component